MRMHHLEKMFVNHTLNSMLGQSAAQVDFGTYEAAADSAALAFMLAAGAALQDNSIGQVTDEEIVAHIRKVLEARIVEFLGRRSEGQCKQMDADEAKSVFKMDAANITDESRRIARRLGISLEPHEK